MSDYKRATFHDDEVQDPTGEIASSPDTVEVRTFCVSILLLAFKYKSASENIKDSNELSKRQWILKVYSTFSKIKIKKMNAPVLQKFYFFIFLHWSLNFDQWVMGAIHSLLQTIFSSPRSIQKYRL